MISQDELCRQYASQKAYVIPPEQVYREVHTGTELWERPQLTLLREAIRRHEINVVIVYAIDRLSRDPVHLGVLLTEAEHHGVRIEFVSEPLDNTPEGQLVRFVRGYAARVENESRRERSVRGKRTRVLSGKVHNHGSELYGYRRDKELGVRHIYEPEARVVRLIFEWVAVEHLGLRSVAKRLTQEQIPPPSDGKLTFRDGRTAHWGKTQICRILTQPAYKGEPIEWRWSRQAKLRQPEEWIHLPPSTTPAIVSPSLYAQAQQRLTENRGETQRNETLPFLLRGRVTCGVCGRSMRPEANGKYRNYRCSSRGEVTGRCAGRDTPAKTLEEWAWLRLAQVIHDPSIIAGEQRRRKEEGPNLRLVAEKEEAEKALARIERQQERLLHQYRESEDESVPWKLVEREIARAEGEKKQIKETLDRLESRLAEEALEASQAQALEDYCQRVEANLKELDFSEKRLAVDAFNIQVIATGRDEENWRMRGSAPLGDSGVVDRTC